jgi:tetratricopeptide (TPR) repeat protein
LSAAETAPFGYGARLALQCPRRSRLIPALAFVACVLIFAARSEAQVPVSAVPSAAPAAGSDEAAARQHFDRALELYRAGLYAEALEELEASAKLDPNGKDLFFNLALVHEKLGQLPDAIASLERFRALETDSAERERARLTIERLRGAQQAGEIARRNAAACPKPPPQSPPPSQPYTGPVLIAAASTAVVSLIVGTVFGVKALSDDVGDVSTSASLSVAQLRERGRRAEREALVADIAFAVSAASAGTFAGVWLLSPQDSTQRAAGITLRSYF